MKTPTRLPLLLATALALALAALTGTAESNLDLARRLNDAFVQVADQVSPSVVVITVTQKSGSQTDDSSSSDDSIPPDMRRFFRRRFQQGVPDQPLQGEGSGIIIRKDGYILTNHHVVEDADKIEVRLKDGRTFTAEVRGMDTPADVAVIKINATDLPVARFADSSKTRVGEFAIAIGAPFSLEYSVTFGHVSAKDRTSVFRGLDALNFTDQDFIQTDANINPGNSGGPLVNIEGEVIGVNTLIRGLHTGIGFAIPSNLAREISDQLIANGKFARAWLGITIATLRESPEYKEVLTGVKDGVVVRAILADGPSAKSDLRPADVINSIDGQPVITSEELKNIIRIKPAGKKVQLVVTRQADHTTNFFQTNVFVTPGLMQDEPQQLASAAPDFAPVPGPSSPSPAPSDQVPPVNLGVTVKTLTHGLARQYKVDLTEGVIVIHVEKDGLAAANGIKEGDIITSVNKQAVTNPVEFRDALQTSDPQKGVILNLISDGNSRFQVLKPEDN